MSTSEDLHAQLAGQVRVLQIIVASVVLGPVAFLGYVLFLAPPGEQDAGLFMTYLACGATAAAVAARLIVPPLVVRSQRRQIAAGVWSPPGQNGNALRAPATDAGKLGAVYTARTMIAVAILEGAAFFLVVAYQLERNPLALAVAIPLIIVIAAHFPSQARVAEWVERQLRRLDEDRQLEQLRR
jgi:hypothetical protein